jgi:hypothetical protein
VEVVSCHKPVKDGRTVRQLLIDSYAGNRQKDETEKEESMEDDKNKDDQQELQEAVQDLRKGKKYPTPFLTQMRVLAKRTFKQRRVEILCWRQIILNVVLAVLSGLLWLRLDKDGALPLSPLLVPRLVADNASLFNTCRVNDQRSQRVPVLQVRDGGVHQLMMIHCKGVTDVCLSSLPLYSSMQWLMMPWYETLLACTYNA